MQREQNLKANSEMRLSQMKKILSIGILSLSFLLIPSLSKAQIVTTNASSSGGGGGVPADIAVDQICFDVTNHDTCFNYGPGDSSDGETNQIYLTAGTTATEFAVFGYDGGTPDTAEMCVIRPTTGSPASGTVQDIFECNRGDHLGNNNLQIKAATGVLLNVGSDIFGAFGYGTNIRSDKQLGFSQTVSGISADAITAGFQWLGAALIKATDGDTGYGTLDVLGLKASGAAGASCAVTVVAHLTVVNGVVTVCN